MPSLETIMRPRRNRISITVPKEYGSYSFQVILIPLAKAEVSAPVEQSRKGRSFVDVLLSCPKLDDGEPLVEDRRALDLPSAFDRAGCFDTEDFS